MKDFFELLRECLGTLTINKLRTGLAALGIIIGIGSVIALISLGQASQKAIESQIQSLGSNLLTVIPGGQSSGGIRTAAGGGTSLTLDDALAIEKSTTLTTIQAVSPEYTSRSQVTAGANNTNTQIIGVYPAYQSVHNMTLESGEFITLSHVSALSKVAVLGPTVATTLYGDTASAIGAQLRLSGQLLTVIGVTAPKGGAGFQNPDDAIYVPLSTAQKILFGANHLSTIAIQATSADVMTAAQNEVGYFLMDRHKISDVTKADFSIFSQNDILNTASQVTGTFTTLLGGIAAISLLVGGIGIMNIMLVTVTERTREIGLRKALGAKKRIIITQFLLEAILLTIFGGSLGMIFGITVSYLLSSLLSMPFTVSLQSVLLAIGVSGGIGVLFGWYPARTAANLQPIEALRYE